MDSHPVSVYDTCLDRCFQRWKDAPDRRHPRIVDLVDDVGHEHGIAVARVDALVEAVGRRKCVVVQSLGDLLVEVDDGGITLPLLIVGREEEGPLEAVSLVALVIHQDGPIGPEEVGLFRIPIGDLPGVPEAGVGHMIVRVDLMGRPGHHIGIGIFRFDEGAIRYVVPGQNLGARTPPGHEAVPRLLRPLPIRPKIDGLRQVDPRLVVRVELGEALVADLIRFSVHRKVGALVSVYRHQPHVPVVIQQDVLAILRPSPGTNGGIHLVLVVLGVYERGGDVGRDVSVLARGELVGVIMPVLVIQEVGAIGRNVVGPPGSFQDHLPVTGPHIDGVHVLVLAAVQIPHELVLGVVPTGGPGASVGRCDVVHRIVGEPDELIGPDPID